MKKQTAKKSDTDLVTKKEFNERLDRVDVRFDKIGHLLEIQAKAIIKNTEDITIMKETLATKDDVNKILTVFDNYINKSQDVERKSIVNTHRIMEIETKVSDLGKRVGVLESSGSK